MSIPKDDRDFLRFLWWKNLDQEEVKVYRHCRVVFGVSSSPFLLAATIINHLEKVPEKFAVTAEQLKESLYVDNCVTSVDSQEELEKFETEARHLMDLAKFDLRGWEYSGMEKVSSVLGLSWNLKTDTLSVDLKGLKLSDVYENPITKRTILSVAHQVYDPIGFTCPVTVLPKMLLQETWKMKTSWDVELPENICKKFLKWIEQLPLLADIKIPRWIFGHENKKCDWSMHVFNDASKAAYASCVFIRAENENTVSCQLIVAKARVSPVKKMTIPRLELLACCIGSRLAESVKKYLKYPDINTYYWSDSSTALCWIKRDDQWGTFVWNRVEEIRNTSNRENWRHVPGLQNPADLPSRGCSAKELLASRWWEGPSWLKLPKEYWPNSELRIDEDEVNIEKKKSVVSTLNSGKRNEVVQQLFYSIRENCTNDRLDMQIYQKYLPVKGHLMVEEINEAELKLLKIVQVETFVDEKHNSLNNIIVFKDENGLIRTKTKIFNREDLENFRCPIVLPSRHPVVEMLIREKHFEMSHAGIQILMSCLREKFWILASRRSIRSVITKCLRCRRYQTKNIEVMTPPLPRDRVSETASFEIVGIDLCGPLYLKSKEKAWIVIFTCAVYRAIHLELVTSLSTSAFLQAFRRFVSKRGRPHTVYSDNGTNFVGADNAFGKLDWKTINEDANMYRIKWKFNPGTASWWGGFWERLIRMIKDLLKRFLGKSTVYYEELLTIVAECESIINSRPLTYVSERAEDLTPLTPMMFIRDLIHNGVPEIDILDSKDLNQRLQYVQTLREEIRSRFRKEYLGQLTLRRKKEDSYRVKIGDIVLIGDDQKKRMDWILARVIELFPGKDGEVRVVKVKTKTGELMRPVQRLFPMEVTTEGEELRKKEIATITPPGKSDVVTRSGRKINPQQRLNI